MKFPSFYTRLLVAIVCLATSPSVFALQSDALAKGAIIERVICRADPGQSYALFLPAGYTPEKQWPIIYCFDPAARGRVPVERFKAAAEKYGVIVAGSNNSRNGTSDVAAAVNAMMNDTRERLAIDRRRVYTAGFSGGGRVATAVALSLGNAVAGVIACGGGFPASVAPSKAVTFALFATAGNEDFNYPEMRSLTRAFERLGLANRFATFDGGHDWLPPGLAEEAIAWLELQAMKADRRARDEMFVNESFDQTISRARAAEAAGKSYEAYIRYTDAARDFKGLHEVAELEKRAAELKDTKAIKQAIKQEDEQEREQQARVKELYRLKASLRGQDERQELAPDRLSDLGEQPPKNNDERQQVYADLQKNLAALKKKSDAPPGSSERLVARRVINEFFVYLSEQAHMLQQRKQYAAAADNLTMAALIAPDNPRLLYNLACAHALNRDRPRALDALRRAIDKGFKDAAAIESDKDLELLRDDPAYKQIVEELKKKG
jgi:predicted esterase